MSQQDYERVLTNIKEKEKKLKTFEDLLNDIKDLDTRKKILWLDIYSNAIDDREKASILFTDTFQQTCGNVANHNILGPVIAKYLERMSRANDQLLKLAELVANEVYVEPEDENSLYDKIGKFDDMGKK